jgi:hypothetical protein
MPRIRRARRLEHADPARLPVPQAVEGAGKEDAGAKVEAIGATATLGAWTSAAQALFPLPGQIC